MITNERRDFTHINLPYVNPSTSTIPLLIILSENLSRPTLEKLRRSIASGDLKQTYYQFIHRLRSSTTVDEIGFYLGAVKSFVELDLECRVPDPSYDKHFIDFDDIMKGFIPTYTSETLRQMSWAFCSVVSGQDGCERSASILHLISDDENKGYDGKLETYWKRRLEMGDHDNTISSLSPSKYVAWLLVPVLN